MSDIHGCFDHLQTVLAWVQADLAAHPADSAELVFLGDYCDRGSDTRGVIDTLLEVEAGPIDTVFLRGNHDAYFMNHLAGNPTPDNWPNPNMGGTETLASYGLGFEDGPDAVARAIPADHRAFLDRTRLWHRSGGYLFVHAGIKPGIPVEEQDPQDLLFIRRPFLDHKGPHGAVVVHGHTPTDRVTHHGNRIAVDTGAVFGGMLSVLVLDGADAVELSPRGRVPILKL